MKCCIYIPEFCNKVHFFAAFEIICPSSHRFALIKATNMTTSNLYIICLEMASITQVVLVYSK